MKKNVLNTLGVVGIMAMVALNIYVVTSKETPAFLKWDAMSYIFAKGNSGSGSGTNMLPDVTIECSGEDDGKCYTEGTPIHSLGPFGLPMCETTCTFTGYPNDNCASGMPC